MALQTSGAISLSNLQAEFGGSNPISVSEYYRGGSYVPATISSTSTTNSYSSNGDLNSCWWDRYNSGNAHFISADLRINGAWYYCVSGNSYTVGSSTYSRSSTFRIDNVTNYGDSCGGSAWNQYKFKVWHKVTTVTNNTSVNTGVPSSGTASFSQYYGGTNS